VLPLEAIVSASFATVASSGASATHPTGSTEQGVELDTRERLQIPDESS